MRYKQALLYLSRFINYEKFHYYNYKKAFTLEKVKRLLLLLGNPQEQYPSIIVAGTKGKGSTATILASILEEAGEKTGLFTSPHLISLRERIKIGRRPISEKEFCNTLSLIKDAIDKDRMKSLTFFEILTAAAFLYFAKKQIDIAVLEVGLGGRLDATNVAAPPASCITPISYDHMHLLGNSIKGIAGEKCGVINKGSYVVSAPQAKEALKVIRECVRRKEAKLLLAGKDIAYSRLRVSVSGTSFDIKTPFSYYKNLKTPLIGRHQATNSLVAVGMADILKRRFAFDIKEKDIRGGIRKAGFPGRFQIVSKAPYIILDGAQNEASAISLKETLLKLFRKTGLFLILGVSADKDIEGIGKTLCPLADEVIFTKAHSPRALAPEALSERLSKYCKERYLAYDLSDALVFLKGVASKKDAILITGSLFLVGEALKVLGNKPLAPAGRQK